MESTDLTPTRRRNNTLDLTVELPVLRRAAGTSVDIYLPGPTPQWHGPALLAPVPSEAPEPADPLSPPVGMLRSVATTLIAEARPAPPKASRRRGEIKSYARRSARRGLLYSLLFLLAIAAAGALVYAELDTILGALFATFE